MVDGKKKGVWKKNQITSELHRIHFLERWNILVVGLWDLGEF